MSEGREMAFRLVGDDTDIWRRGKTYWTPAEQEWLEVHLGSGLTVSVNPRYVLEWYWMPEEQIDGGIVNAILEAN